MSARARERRCAGPEGVLLVAAIGAGLGCSEAPEGPLSPRGVAAGAERAREVASTSITDTVDPRAWVALRQRLRRAPHGSARSGGQGLADLLRPALLADLLSTPLCEELLRTARVLRSERASGASAALAAALEGVVSSMALDPQLASEAVLQRMEVGDLSTTSARARLHWLVDRAGLGGVEARVLRTLEHGSCDERCTQRFDQACDEVQSDAASVRLPNETGGSSRASAAHAWHEPPHAAARTLEWALSNFLDGEPKRE